jgi:hypothetical protein
MVRHVGRNVGRIGEQSLGRSFDRNFEQSFIRNVGQTLDRIVIDRHCEWKYQCSISGSRSC